jgi:hypothetical protein
MQKEQIVKSLDEELKQATYVCMFPGEDLHGDNITIEEVRKACHAFNRSPRRANLFHKAMTDSVEFVESYILPTDIEMQVADGSVKSIPKGAWLVVTQTTSDEIWKAQKDGRINGVSIGALGKREEIEVEE